MKKKTKAKQKQKQKQKQTVVVKIDNSRKTIARPRTSNAAPALAPQHVILQPQIHVSHPPATFQTAPAPVPSFNPTPVPKKTFQTSHTQTLEPTHTSTSSTCHSCCAWETVERGHSTNTARTCINAKRRTIPSTQKTKT